MKIVPFLALSLQFLADVSWAFAPNLNSITTSKSKLLGQFSDDDDISIGTLFDKAAKNAATLSLSLAIILGSTASAFADTTASAVQQYDGFAEYAKENQMEQSDVGCFINKCGEQTKGLFSNPRGIKGVSCLGRCKGEQSCATRCVDL